ncbi:dihydrofolate reductase [Massilia sp. DWR3-1-1]|uniref:dihydrofolate reductase n=1 Tax=Massilia sp. DWR3-1-1 TaxID=2804559 RepID=UPI003CE7EF6D
MTRPVISLVVAMDAGRGIGIDNALPWHLPEDLAHFKRVTTGHPIIMGRKTFDSIGRPLPNRRNIVVTRDAGWTRAGVETAGSLEAAIALAGQVDACIIGGAQIFAQAIDAGLAGRMVVTEIDQHYPCDTFFPPLPAGWVETARERQQSASGVHYSFVTYEKAH